MTNIRNELVATARHTIGVFGEKMTLRKITSSSYDVDTGVRTQSTTEYCVRVSFVRDERSEQASLTRSESRRAYIAPQDCIEIDTSDVIIGAGDRMKISAIHGVLEGKNGGLIYFCTVQG